MTSDRAKFLIRRGQIANLRCVERRTHIIGEGERLRLCGLRRKREGEREGEREREREKERERERDIYRERGRERES